LAIQIFQYEFLGPILLDEWGPPMEEVVYLIMARQNEKFTILYVDETEKVTEKDFFTKNPRFKCWLTNSGKEKNMYLSIYPMWKSERSERLRIVHKVISGFKPVCNLAEPESSQEKPEQPELGPHQFQESNEESETSSKKTQSEDTDENQ